MRALNRRVGPFFAWQAAALAAVFAISAAGAFVLGRSGETGAGAGLGEDEQIVAARVGDLIDSIWTSGTVVFPDRESAAFAVEGEVAEVLVAEGAIVAAGQALAVIDDATAAELARAVAEAEVKLREAREALESALAGPDAVLASVADAALARAELADAEEALAEALAGPDELEMALLQAEVAVQEQALATAQEEFAGATLTAPIAGIVETVAMEVGDKADQASVFIEIVDPSIVHETAAFEVAGEVASVLVAEGDVVIAGQALATLDDTTTASLDKAVADAEVKARDAAEALAFSGVDPVESARAEEAAARARISLRDAEDALADLMEATPAETADAETAIANAAESLANARADLSTAEEKAAEDVAEAVEAAADAEASYAGIFRRWLGITPSEAEIDAPPETLLARWGVDLDALIDSLDALRGEGGPIEAPPDDPATPWNETVVYTWLLFPGPIVGTCDDQTSSQALCVEREMEDAWAVHNDATDALSAVTVEASRSVLTAASAVVKAEDELAAAEEALETLLSPDPLDIAAAEADVVVARAELDDSEEALAEALSGSDPLTVNQLRTALAVAEQALAGAREQLARATLTAPVAGVVKAVAMEPGDRAEQESAFIEIAGPTSAPKRETAAFGVAGEVAGVLVEEGDAVREGQALARIDDATAAALEKAVADAEVKARDALAALLEASNPDNLAVAKATVSVAAAQSKLAAAEAALAEAETNADTLSVALLRSELAVAEQAFATAEANLAGATLRSAIAGVVSDVSMAPGDRTGQSVSIEIVDPSVVEIEGSVDEIDVLAVSVGMPAAVTLSALEGQTLEGEVVAIGAAGAGATDVVSFPITIRLDVPAGMSLREGLSAVAELVLAEYPGVLLTPTSSIGGSILAPTVRVSSGGVIEERSVALGPSDDFWVVVLDGLAEGEQVVMPEPSAAGVQFGGFGAVFGGGNPRGLTGGPRQGGGGGG